MILKLVAVCLGGIAKDDQSNPPGQISRSWHSKVRPSGIHISNILKTHWNRWDPIRDFMPMCFQRHDDPLICPGVRMDGVNRSGEFVWLERLEAFCKHIVYCHVMPGCYDGLFSQEMRSPFLRERFGSLIITFWAVSTDLCDTQFENSLYETISYEVNNEKLLFRVLWQSLSLQMLWWNIGWLKRNWPPPLSGSCSGWAMDCLYMNP
jgi:hypothetical protein